MESKYYTPKIEEFHVGFEYEALFTDKKKEPNLRWVKMNEPFQFKRFYEWLELPEPGLRVKYLDKEDIVSCGFNTGKPLDMYYYTLGDYSLMFVNTFPINGYKVRFVSIKDKLDNIIFHGNIKNKSVFKILLIQLSILKDEKKKSKA
jgi:hypothetical protein